MDAERYVPSHERILAAIRKLLEERLSIALTPEFYRSFITACHDTGAFGNDPANFDAVPIIENRRVFEEQIESIDERYLGREVKKHLKVALSKAIEAASAGMVD